jgi:adenosine deaminase
MRALPKAEHNNHLVGSTQSETLLWLADQGDLKAPFETFEEVRDFFSYTDIDHFIRVYSTVVDCSTKEDQFERIAYDILETGHHCNVLDVETSFSAPDHVRKGLDYAEMLDVINRGLREGKSDFGVDCRLRIDLVMNYGPDYGM